MKVNGFIIPESIIEKDINDCLEYIRQEYNAKTDKKKSIIGIIANDQSIGTYSMFDQLVEILITTKKSNRTLELQQSYKPDDAKYPSIYLNLSSEKESHSSLGLGEGDHGLIDGNDNMIFDDENNTETPILAKRYDASYYLTIVSDNKNETIALYHFLKALMLSIIWPLESKGLQNISFVGHGHVFDANVPSGLHLRVLEILLNYETYSPAFASRIIPVFGGVKSILKEQLEL